MTLDPVHTIIAVFVLMYGLILGSFANVVIYRLPRGQSIARPPSSCPSCGRRLTVWDLIPVLSWLFLRGRCRGCKAPISVRYCAVEMLCGALFLGMVFYAGFGLGLIPLSLFVFMLVCITFIDADTQEIPDGLLIFGGVVGILWVAGSYLVPMGAPGWRDALFGALAGATPLFIIDRLTILIAGKEGFGFGDVKLMAVSGLFLGWQAALVALFFAVVLGGMFGGVMLALRKLPRGAYIPFGPFLAAGLIVALWFGDAFLHFMLAGGV